MVSEFLLTQAFHLYSVLRGPHSHTDRWISRCPRSLDCPAALAKSRNTPQLDSIHVAAVGRRHPVGRQLHKGHARALFLDPLVLDLVSWRGSRSIPPHSAIRSKPFSTIAIRSICSHRLPPEASKPSTDVCRGDRTAQKRTAPLTPLLRSTSRAKSPRPM